MKLFLLHQFDPLSKNSGGIGKFCLSLIKDYPGDEIILVCGTSSKSSLGKFVNVCIDGFDIKILPIFLSRDKYILKLKMPLTLSYIFGLFRYRAFLSDRSFKIVLNRFEYFFPLIFTPLKKVLIIHSDIEKNIYSKNSEIKWSLIPSLYLFLISFVMHRVDLVLSVNSASKNFLKKKYNDLMVEYSPTWPDRRIFSVLDEFSCRSNKLKFLKDYGLSEDCKILLFVGRLELPKNFPLLLNALRLLPESYICLVAGSGSLLNTYIDMVDDFNLSKRVKFLGSISQFDLNIFYNISDIYISTSFYEGMSVAQLEALCCGLPVVTTCTGESDRIIIDEFNGFLIGYSADELSYKVRLIIEGCLINKSDCVNSVVGYSSSIIYNQISSLGFRA
jgi:glycosyltransferase involved in cell wall biosynthesis